MKPIVVLLLIALFQLSSPLWAVETVSATPTSLLDLPSPEKDKAQIIFLKPTLQVVGKVSVQIFDVTDTETKLVGVMLSKTRMILNVAPGKHRFMSTTFYGSAHFMEADLEPGKRYFVLLRAIYNYGFQFRPIKRDGPSDYRPENTPYESWIADSTENKMTPETEASYRGNKRSQKWVARAQQESWGKWLAKTPEQRAELTLNKTDFLD
ncbi:MAG: hypothetical protein ACREPB_03795 [Arenimonas sp.]